MPQLKRMTCLSYLKDGQRITTQPDEDTEHLTLQEELYEDSDCEGQDGQGYEHETQFQKFLRSSYATGMIYTILLIFVGGSLIALISVISQVVLPFWTVHGYCNTTCVPWELIVEEGKTCMCGVGCTAQYRCLITLVAYRDNTGLRRNATVYEDESEIGKECSFYPSCKTSPGLISDSVNEYEARYETIGQSFTCWHGDHHLGHVIRTRKYHVTHIVNGILWSVVVFIVSTAALVWTLKKCNCQYR